MGIFKAQVLVDVVIRADSEADAKFHAPHYAAQSLEIDESGMVTSIEEVATEADIDALQLDDCPWGGRDGKTIAQYLAEEG